MMGGMIVSNPPGPFDPSWESLERYVVPEWYLDAKFGIFIHWGVYTVPAFGSEWYPRHMYVQGTKEFDHHVATYGPQSEFGYKDFIPQFTAPLFDATAWARLFRDAGARFVVPVAEHHDGFAMYATKRNKWNSLEMGPKRDVIGELAAATRAEGMVFGLSTHRAEHWWFLNGGRAFESDVQDPAYGDFYGPAAPDGTQPDEKYLEDWLNHCVELIDGYRPQLFYFDWWIEEHSFAPYLRRFASYYYNRAYGWGQGVAVNYKHEAFPEKAAVYDVERGQLADIRQRFWQTDTAIAKNSWCHIDGLDYKEASSIVHDLVDIVSKNGSLLLNVGPKADGAFAAEDEAILRSIGRWLSVNGEAIYGSRPWKVFGEGPTKVVAGSFKDVDRDPFTAEDIRFTTKGDVLYAVVLSVDTVGEVLIRSLGSSSALHPGQIGQVSVLGGSDLEFERTAEGLRVRLTGEAPCEHAFTLKVETAAPA